MSTSQIKQRFAPQLRHEWAETSSLTPELLAIKNALLARPAPAVPCNKGRSKK